LNIIFGRRKNLSSSKKKYIQAAMKRQALYSKTSFCEENSHEEHNDLLPEEKFLV